MAIDALRDGVPGDPSPLSQIGQPDQDVFGCPACARPLAFGTRRCPGCGTRLVSGVRATTASTFIVLGVVIGLLVGGGATAMLGVRLPALGGTTAVPTTGPAATTAPSMRPAPTTPPISGIVGSALRQSATVNLGLAESGSALAGLLASEPFDARTAAAVLRDVASGAALGSELMSRTSSTPAVAGLSRDLAAFYSLVRVSARDGLTATVTNTEAYRASAATMVALLTTELPPVDADLRDFAASVDLDLPKMPPQD